MDEAVQPRISAGSGGKAERFRWSPVVTVVELPHLQRIYIYVYTYIYIYRVKAEGSPEANCIFFCMDMEHVVFTLYFTVFYALL